MRLGVVSSVLLKPLPYADGSPVLRLQQRNGNGSMCCLPYGNFYRWARDATGFEALGATTGRASMTLTGQGEPRSIPVTMAPDPALPVSHPHFNTPRQ